MKNLILVIALIISALTSVLAQDTREVTRDTAYIRWSVTSTDTAWFYTREITYADGGSTINNIRTGDTTSTRTYLINQVIDDQRLYANAIQTVANYLATANRTTLISTMLDAVTGRNYGQNLGQLFGDQLIGRYTVQVTGQPSFVADMVRLSSGSMRLRRQDNPATEYQVTLWSERSFRVSNLPGASGNRDLAYRNLNSAGRKTYSTADRTVRLQRRDGAPFVTQNR